MQMNRANKIINLVGVPLPLIGLVIAIVLLWNQAIGPLELGLMIGLYVITARPQWSPNTSQWNVWPHSG